MAKEFIGGIKLRETFGDFLAVKPFPQEVLLYPPQNAIHQETMTQEIKQTRRRSRKNSSSSASIPLITSILFTKRYRKYILLLAKGREPINSKKESYHILILKKNNIEKINHLKLKGKLSNYLIITFEPSYEFYNKIRKHFNNGESSRLEKNKEVKNG